MNSQKNCTIENVFEMFSGDLSASDILISKLMAQVSSSIIRERLKLGMNQTAFANYIGVQQSQVSRWEQGDYNFSIKKIAEIAEKLELDVNISLTDKKATAAGMMYFQHPQFTQTILCRSNNNFQAANKVRNSNSYKKAIYLQEEFNYATVC